MGTPGEAKPVKLLVALPACDEELFPPVESELSALFGPIESASENLAWSLSDYYEREMGLGLLRRVVFFGSLAAPNALSEIKLKTQSVE